MDFSSLKDRIVWFTITGLVSWMVFLTYTAMASATRDDVSEAIRDESPYVADRRLIMLRLDGLTSLSSAINDSGKDIQALRVDVERMLVQQEVIYQKLEEVERKIDGRAGT